MEKKETYSYEQTKWLYKSLKNQEVTKVKGRMTFCPYGTIGYESNCKGTKIKGLKYFECMKIRVTKNWLYKYLFQVHVEV